MEEILLLYDTAVCDAVTGRVICRRTVIKMCVCICLDICFDTAAVQPVPTGSLILRMYSISGTRLLKYYIKAAATTAHIYYCTVAM